MKSRHSSSLPNSLWAKLPFGFELVVVAIFAEERSLFEGSSLLF